MIHEMMYKHKEVPIVVKHEGIVKTIGCATCEAEQSIK